MGIQIVITRKEPSQARGWRRITKRGLISVGVAVSLVGVASGVALATIPDASGVFHGCVNNATGALRVIDTGAGQTCTGAERAISWNQQGIIWKGGWSAATAYIVGDAVSYQGSSYVSKKANTNVIPLTTTAGTWSLLASEGSPGLQGAGGKTVLNGSGPPSILVGNTGDFFIDTLHHVIYGPAKNTCVNLKCETAWGTGSSLVGPAGTGTAYDNTGGYIDLPSGASERIVTQTITVGGDYSVAARVQAQHNDTDGALFQCDLVAANPGGQTVILDSNGQGTAGAQTYVTLTLDGVVSIAAGGIVAINCNEGVSQKDDAINSSHIVSTQVSNLVIVGLGG